jgi:hypothetical protein
LIWCMRQVVINGFLHIKIRLLTSNQRFHFDREMRFLTSARSDAKYSSPATPVTGA